MTSGAGAVCVLATTTALHERFERLLAASGVLGVRSPVEDASVIVLASADAAVARITSVRDVAAAHRRARVVTAMPTASRNAMLRRAMLAGAHGIVLDDELDAALGATTIGVATGQLVMPPSLRAHVAPRPLSYREKEILGLVVQGLSNRQVADRLFVAESTVKTHLSSAFAKLDAHSRSEVAARLLDPEVAALAGVGSLPVVAAAAEGA